MSINLSPPVKVYDVFQGCYNQEMGTLRARGYIPLSVADVMQKRLEIAALLDTDGTHLDSDWFSSYFHTGDGVASAGDKLKIVLQSRHLFNITPKTSLDKEGALVITSKAYTALEGVELNRRQLEKAGINYLLSKKQAKQHPFWRALAGDQHLLNEYADLIFSLLKERTAMGVHITDGQDPSMRALCLNWVGDDWRSDALDRYRLVDDSARLVGVLRRARFGRNTHVSGLETCVRLDL